ncbi:hypothetical protein D922_01403 [Enterococcus faecalis 06-MB-DW-09]|nr:hypothetical protein D922_01403 [Enterococcus faecalis 06-MB-DW-09]
MVRVRGRNYFAHIIQHDYVFHPDEWQFEAKSVHQSTKWKNKLLDSCWFDFTCQRNILSYLPDFRVLFYRIM